MCSYQIRALALHLALEDLEDYGRVEEAVSKLVEVAGKVQDSLGVKVRTLRLILPYLEDVKGHSGSIFDRVLDLAESEGVNYVAVPLKRLDKRSRSELLDALEREKLFTSIGYVEGLEKEVATFLRLAEERYGWFSGVRIGVCFGPRPETPYFPITVSKRRGLSASLLYPSFLLEEMKRGATISEAIRELSAKV